jgi:8-oxo-dGTP diphosphatase
MRDFDPNYQEVPVLAKIGQKIVVFNDKKEILFLRRSEKCSRPGGWDFPGGGIDFGEDPIKGILREVEEETQLTISEVEPIHLESTINGHGDFVIMVGYKATTSDNTPNLSWEHDAYKWVSEEEALKIELPEVHKKFLEKALRNS